jgi:F-type H+-transporting ATPase subunit epsilon
MKNISLDIVTPTKNLNLEDITYLRCPGLDGSFGVLSNHQEGIFALGIGELKVLKNGQSNYFSVGGGFAEIISNKIKLLVESVESSSEIDFERANNSLTRATKRKSNLKSNYNQSRNNASIMRAINRLKVSKR